MNKVELLGRLTKDPEIRFTNTNNVKVASFTLAINRKVKGEADFINCIAWKGTADIIDKYIKKGRQIAIVGRIETRNYEDKDGSKRYITEVVAEEVYFADSKKEETSESTEEDQETFFGDDLPF